MGQKSHFYAFYTASLFLWLAGGPCAQASNYFTRFTVGSYLSDENFSNAVDGTTRNSFSTVSSRAYFRVSELDNKNIEVIGDIRDTHDFFEKLDTERLELTAQNNLQVKQLSIKDTELTQNTFVQLGRLPVFEAGAISVDGALLGYHLDHISSLALFGGLNPQRIDQKSAQWNPDSQNFGLYYRYQPQYDSWYDSLVGNMAVVVQRVQNHTDRFYYYGNYYHQWDSRNTLIAMGYLDFVPSFKIQTAYLSHGRILSPIWYSSLSLSAIDVIEYSRRRGVLERLSPSNYQEGTLHFEEKNSEDFTLNYNLIYGIRSSDHLSRIEGNAGFSLAHFTSQPLSLQTHVGYRKNFTSNDQYIRGSLNYTSQKWESDLDLEYGLRKQTSGGMYHPIIGEVSYANYLTKALYGTVSLQYAENEDVRIISGFFKLGYRLGSDDVAPLRNGSAPVEGRL